MNVPVADPAAGLEVKEAPIGKPTAASVTVCEELSVAETLKLSGFCSPTVLAEGTLSVGGELDVDATLTMS